MSVTVERTHGIGFLDGLLAGGDQAALVVDGRTLTRDELAARIHRRAVELGSGRRLVLVGISRQLDPLVTYLAALAAGHVVVLADGDAPETLADLEAQFDPDVVHRADAGIDVRRPIVGHDLHPDLALLLSTSGSTGSPRLVRLSSSGLDANAAAIASSLGLVDGDCGITSLPLHYCYGLSVLHSHLAVGAPVVVTEASVVDPCFWTAARDAGVTGIAGVPHTFELLDRRRFERADLPTLRYLTQAGGRLAPEVVERWAARGSSEGWDLFVMYGQTEATARMAYLPPELALHRPEAVGIPIDGGSFEIVPVEGAPAGAGEVVYRGPNVMLGYATGPDDLARGREVHELRTGDLGRLAPDGLLEIVGRASRFIKPMGLRIDLDHLEGLLAGVADEVVCTGDDEGLVVAIAPAAPDQAGPVAARASTAAHLPPASVAVATFDRLPRLANGKPDLVAVRTAARSGPRSAGAPSTAATTPASVVAAVLGVDQVDEQASFVELGGDSLTYVEASIRLEAVLGALPPDWHHRPVAELAPGRRRRFLHPVDTSVVVRAAAICLVLVTHTRVALLHGGAHALVAVAGWNFASFQLRSGRMGRAIGRIVVPSVAYIAVVAAVSADFGWRHALLVNGLLGPPDSRWAFWFVESLVLILVGLWAAWQVPAVRRAEARWPFGLPMALALAGLVTRFDLVGPFGEHEVLRPEELVWLFALGWAGARAETPLRRLAVSAVLVAAVPGFFDDMPGREVRVLILVLALVWVPRLWVPPAVARMVGPVAAASLGIYLVHWEVLPVVMPVSKPLAVVASLGAGLALWAVLRRLTAVVERGWDRRPTVGAVRSALGSKRPDALTSA